MFACRLRVQARVGSKSSPELVRLLRLHLKLPAMMQGEPGMPWPADLHAQPYAPLSSVQPYERRFLVSATHRVMPAHEACHADDLQDTGCADVARSRRVTSEGKVVEPTPR